jgi:antitoxin MazE
MRALVAYIHCVNRQSEPYPLPPGVSAREGDFVKVRSDDFDALIMQDTRVFKAGNSLAIRIPSAVAKRLELEDGAPVEMAVDDGMIIVRKAASRELSELIDRITPDNMHEPMFDDLVGGERW